MIPVDVKNLSFLRGSKGKSLTKGRHTSEVVFCDIIFTNLTDTKVFDADDPTSSLRIIRCRFNFVIVSIYAPITFFSLQFVTSLDPVFIFVQNLSKAMYLSPLLLISVNMSSMYQKTRYLSIAVD